MKPITTCILILLWGIALPAQYKGVVVGPVGLPIEAVQIKNVNTGKGAVSDSSGVFFIKADDGDFIEFKHLNYVTLCVPLITSGLDTVILQSKDFPIAEINVSTRAHEGYDNMGAIGIKRVPAFMGEQDVLKYLSTLPGVTSLGMLDAGIYVRGGNSSQNAYLVNGIQLADPQHIAGIMSTFDPYILNHSRFYKSGYPSKYNGYLSSYIDMQPVNYMSQDFTGEITLGLLASSAKARVKYGKRKKSLFAISYRHSYFQLLARGYNRNKEVNEQLPSYTFNDLNMAFSVPVKKDWKASFFGLFTSDDLPMKLNPDFSYGLNWGTFSSILSFSGSVGKGSSALFSVGHNRYTSDVELGATVNSSTINKTAQWNVNTEFKSALSSVLELNYGLNTSFKNYSYNQEIESLSQNAFSNHLIFAFAESQWRLRKKFKFTWGLNASTYLNTGSPVFVSPRLKFHYDHKRVSAWFDYAHSLQFEERMNVFTIQSPVDIWLPVKNQIPSRSHHISIGSQWRMRTTANISFGAFYKKLESIKEFETFNRNNLSQSIGKMMSGEGKSLGAELDLIYNTGALYSRLNYTLSHVKTRFKNINQGRNFNPPYDVRHNVLWNASIKINPQINLNTMWTYKSGRSATVPAGVAVVKDIAGVSAEFIPVFKDRHNYKMPATHRLDINVEYLQHMRIHTLKFNMGAYNLYNQQNPSFVFVQSEFKDDYFLQFKINSKVIFPFMPYISVSYVFSGDNRQEDR
ncbi:TonB-dependent Receptor Plug Domain [Saccharicrinis carchari]|uniref:TonB-dependent Receptor Plug Domain n=1 Tax=Saccharicrinis carchari TaxID=1168039 RepID=A0A521BYX4_SACCC|nr:TonB-dependent receptor [Saccharicrinis carchari]SMO52255.1 TonB-dependent Receptor Plug Domain [Saccharicrinis carchari]